MATIDERVVSVAFNNKQFEAAVAETMKSLTKLSQSLAGVGSVTGFADIDKAAQQVTLDAPMTALDRLKAKLGMAGSGAADGFGEIERSSNKVSLLNPMTALDKLRSKLGQVGAGAADSFGEIEKSANKVNLGELNSSIEDTSNKFSIMAGAAAVAFGNIITKAAAAGASFAKSFSFGPIQEGFKEYETNLNSIQTILANTEQAGVKLPDVNKALKELNDYSDQTIYNFAQMAKNIGKFTAAGVDLDTSVASIKGIANLAALSGSNAQEAATAMTQLSQAISTGKVSLQDWRSVENAGMGGVKFKKSLIDQAIAMGTLDKSMVKTTDKMGNMTIKGQSFRDAVMSKPGEQSWLTKEVLTGALQQYTGDLTDAQLAAQGFTAEQIKGIQKTAQLAKDAATKIKTFPQLMDVVKESIASGWSLTFQTIFGDFEEAKKLFTDFGNYVTSFVGMNADARNKVLAEWKKLGGRTNLIEGIKSLWSGLLTVIKPIQEAFRDIFPKKTGFELTVLTDRFRRFSEQLRLGPEKMEDLKRTFRGLFALVSIGVTVIGKIVKMFFSLVGAAGKGSGGILNFTGGIGDFLVALDKALTDGGLLAAFFDGLTEILKAPIQALGFFADALIDVFKGLAGMDADISVNLGPAKRAVEAFGNVWEKVSDKVSPIIRTIILEFEKLTDAIASAFSDQNFDKTIEALQTGLLAGIFLSIRKALKKDMSIDVGGGLLKNINEMFGVLNKNLVAMQNAIRADTILKIALAIGILAASVLVLSTIDAASLSKSLTAIAAAMGLLLIAMGLLGKMVGRGTFLILPIVATGFIALAAAMLILSVAMKILASMSWGELIKGLAGIGGALAVVAFAMQKMNPAVIAKTAIPLLALATALTLLAIAVRMFGSIPFLNLVQGLVGMGAAIVVLGLALGKLPTKGLFVQAAALGALAAAMILMAGAVAMFGGMGFVDLVQGIGGMAAAIVVLSLALGKFPLKGLFAQAAALGALGVGMTLFAGALRAMGSMDVATMVKGFAAIGIALKLLGVGLKFMTGTVAGSGALLLAAIALGMLVPSLVILGSLSIEGIVKGLAGLAGVFLVLGAAGYFLSPAMFALGIALIPLMAALAAFAGAIWILSKAFGSITITGGTMAKFGLVLAAIGGAIAWVVNKIWGFIKAVGALLVAIGAVAPKIMEKMGNMLGAIALKIVKAAPGLLLAAGKMILGLVKGIVGGVPKVLEAAGKLIKGFINGVLRFLGIKSPSKVMMRIGGQIISGLVGGIISGFGKLLNAGKNLVGNILKGIASVVPKLISSVGSMIGRLVSKVAEVLKKLVGAARNAIGNFISSLVSSIRDKVSSVANTAKNLGGAIINGLVNGIRAIGHKVLDVVKWVVDKIPKRIRKILRIDSPSKVMMDIGEQTMAGLTKGISDNGDGPEGAMGRSGDRLIRMTKRTMSNMTGILDGALDLDPVISPVLDLSAVEKEAERLVDLTKVPPVAADASLAQAAAISEEKTESDTARAEEAAQAGPTLSFEQNNYSPESLSDIEIYRQTKNQLSQAKSALGLSS